MISDCGSHDFCRQTLSAREGCRIGKLIFQKLFFRGNEVSNALLPLWLKEFYRVEQNVGNYALEISVAVDVLGFVGTGEECSRTSAPRIKIHRVRGEYFLHELRYPAVYQLLQHEVNMAWHEAIDRA